MYSQERLTFLANKDMVTSNELKIITDFTLKTNSGITICLG